MMNVRPRLPRLLLAGSIGLAACCSCSSNVSTGQDAKDEGRSDPAGGTLGVGGSPRHDSAVGGQNNTLPINVDDPDEPCVPKTCAELRVNCGPVTDRVCGGVIDCGECPEGELCGSGGPNICGAASATCEEPATCASLDVECGVVGDGCGNTLDCGGCTLPKICGGGGTPGRCGCTGVCSQVPSCTDGAKTTLSGRVYDPAGINPIYHALVYIPNDPSDPALESSPPGVACDQCGAAAAGDPLVTTHTAPDGEFTLEGVPVGAEVTLVIQQGRWRRKFQVSIPTSCGPNALPDPLLMPSNRAQGDIPQIAVVTGNVDEIECVLLKMGIDQSEFTNPEGGGRVHFYVGSPVYDDLYQIYVYPGGAGIDEDTPSQGALFETASDGSAVIDQYDMVILACQGAPFEQTQPDLAALRAYADRGGRVFATHYSYVWLETNGDFANTARWNAGQLEMTETAAGRIDTVSNPKGADFQRWLEAAHVSPPGSGTVDLVDIRRDTDGVIAPTQQWISRPSEGGTQQVPAHFTFNTPVAADSASQCGRVLFSDFHVADSSLEGNYGTSFPSECDTEPMNAQQKLFEFMLFDLASCVEPYTPACTPQSCAAQGLECGPAGDGCGQQIDCGTCPPGQYCGGAGVGKCGSNTTCTPQSCAAQGLECGPAGDGCGGLTDCGNCPTGMVCGLRTPGECDRPSSIH